MKELEPLSLEDMSECLPAGNLARVDGNAVLAAMAKRREENGRTLSPEELARVQALRHERGREAERARALDIMALARKLEIPNTERVIEEAIASGDNLEAARERFRQWELSVYDGRPETWRADARIRAEFPGGFGQFQAFSEVIRRPGYNFGGITT